MIIIDSKYALINQGVAMDSLAVLNQQLMKQMNHSLHTTDPGFNKNAN